VRSCPPSGTRGKDDFGLDGACCFSDDHAFTKGHTGWTDAETGDCKEFTAEEMPRPDSVFIRDVGVAKGVNLSVKDAVEQD
jgi:hypothetical protein